MVLSLREAPPGRAKKYKKKDELRDLVSALGETYGF